MYSGNHLLCPFCGGYMEPVSHKNYFAECVKCDIILTSSSIDKDRFVIRVRPSAKPSVRDTFDFLKLVREGNFDYYFSKEKPFTDGFSLSEVVACNKNDLSKDGNYTIAKIRKGNYDLVAYDTTISHNLSKAFTYASMDKCGLKLKLDEFDSIGAYLFTMACLDTHVSPEMEKMYESDNVIAKRLPFNEGMLLAIGMLPRKDSLTLSDEALLYSLMINGSSDVKLMLCDFDVNSTKRLLLKLTNVVSIRDDYDLSNFTELVNMPDKWREQFLREYCKAVPELSLNVTDYGYSTYSIIYNSSNLPYNPDVFKGDGVIKEVSKLRLFSYLNDKYYFDYHKCLGYENKLNFLKNHGISITSDMNKNVRLFWMTINDILSKELGDEDFT